LGFPLLSLEHSGCFSTFCVFLNVFMNLHAVAQIVVIVVIVVAGCGCHLLVKLAAVAETLCIFVVIQKLKCCVYDCI